MDADGQNQTKLIESPIDAERIYAWPSPDGKHIAITTRNKDPEDSENYVFQSFVADTTQSDVRSLGELVFNDWSPDGRKLLTTTGMDIPEIVVVNPDGRDPTTLTSGYGPTWSPDGTMIAFVRDNHDPVNKYQLYVMNADGTDIRQLTTAGENFHPVWQGR